MEKRSVVVIGAGIAGLSAAVYLQRSGFDVTICEQHRIPGGLSTSWSRKGYFFEGGMHWLTGSSEKLVLNRVWKETGALKENNPVRYREPLYTLIDEKTEIRLYRNIDKMRKEFIEAAPLEVEMANVNDKLTVEPMPHDLLQSELVKRGASEIEAENLVERLSIDEAEAYLSDPNSIDTLMENLRD